MYVAFIVVSCCLFVNGQSVTEPSLLDSVQTATQANVTPLPAQCLSVNKWNKLEGLCINRSHCDYGTPAIDFTLYAARGYKRDSTSRYDAFGSHLNIKHIKNSQKLLNGFVSVYKSDTLMLLQKTFRERDSGIYMRHLLAAL